MKFSEWLQIREVQAAPVAVKNPHLGNQPGEAAKKAKTAALVRGERAKVVGKPPKAQIAALQNAAKKIATDPTADDAAFDDIDDQVKNIQNKNGIRPT